MALDNDDDDDEVKSVYWEPEGTIVLMPESCSGDKELDTHRYERGRSSCQE